MMVIDSGRIRSRLARYAPPTRREWDDAFAATALSGLENRLLDLAPSNGRSGYTNIVLSSRFDSGAAAREMNRQFLRHLARAQFLTALALSLAVAVLGWMMRLGDLPVFPIGIPVATATAAAVGLAVLAIVGRAFLAIAAQPLLDSISTLPFERFESELLRRAAGLPQTGAYGRPGSEPSLSPAIESLLERLVEAIEEARRVLLEATADLRQRAEALTLAAHTIAERPAEGGSGHSAALRTVLEQFAATGDRSAAAPQKPADSAGGAASSPEAPAVSSTELGRELRRLIAELE
jgi:hypothetical protein